MTTTENGILVLMDFYAETAKVLPMSYDVFEELVESILIDTSDTLGKCFCQRDDKNVISILDFKDTKKVEEELEYPEYVFCAWGNVNVTLTLTNGRVIEFSTHYDRFWIDTDGEELQVKKYEDVKEGKVGLK